jgi:cytosine/adenosine deaminase-related metal-dependent hydrolase
LHANAILLGDGTSVQDGALVVEAAGVIVEVGPASTVLPRHPGLAVERIDAGLCPGLSNAHTHLELSPLEGRVPGGRGFPSWVDALVAHRSEVGLDEMVAAASRGARAMARAGTACVGDVTNSLASVPGLRDAGLRGMVFHEFFGLSTESMLERIAREQNPASVQGTRLSYALAPHALSTTHAGVVAALLAARPSRSTMHLGEYDEERECVERGTGATASWLRDKLRLADDVCPWPLRPLYAYADELGLLGPNTLVVHAVVARDDELALLAERRARVVLCPRSNMYIGGRLPRVPRMLQLGVDVCLGTDSLASNRSLDVVAEARLLLDAFPDVSPSALVRMMCESGARALGVADAGGLVPGASPGVFAFPCARGHQDPSRALIESQEAERQWTVPL